MFNFPGKKLKKEVLKIAKEVATEVASLEIVEKIVEVGTDAFEDYKNRITIPDLKDVNIDDALSNLEELGLVPVAAIAQPKSSYSELYENVVVGSEPKFGKKVEPESAVKVYYVTDEVIKNSKELEVSTEGEFKLPRIIGLDKFEAREDLEALGLRVTLKLDTPDIKHIEREDGQVTKITYPDNEKLTSKQKKGERVWLFYVDEDVINESIAIRENEIQKDNMRKEKFANMFSSIPNLLKRESEDDDIEEGEK